MGLFNLLESEVLISESQILVRPAVRPLADATICLKVRQLTDLPLQL